MKKVLILLLSIFLFANNLTKQEQEEAKQGEKAFQKILKKVTISKDIKTLNRIKKVGNRLTKVVNKDYNWEYVLVKDKRLNAFCLPGGKVVVYTGIFKVIKNDDQLAVVLSHEIAHVLLHHGTIKARVNTILSIPKNLGKEVFGSFVPLPFHKVLDTTYDVGKNLTLMMPYGRYQEMQADKKGIDIMYKAGFNVNEAIKFWQNMEKYSKNSPPEFLSTHPSHNHRIELIKEEIKKLKSKTPQ